MTCLTDTSPILLTELVGDSEIACDHAEHEWCAKGVAEWIQFARCPECAASGFDLICTPCKDMLIVTEDGFECAKCEAPVFPARRFIVRIEPLK